MSALTDAYKAFNAQHKGWDADISGGSASPSVPYITPGTSDAEPYDLRRAVREPAVGRDGLPVLGKAPRVRDVKFSVFDGVAPAPLPAPGGEWLLADRIAAEAVADAMADRAAAIRRWAIAEYTGDYPEVLELLMQRQTIAQIATATGYTTRHVLNLVRGNPDRPNDGGGLVAWLAIFLTKVWHADVPISVQQVKTLKKSLQERADMGQLGWDFDALMGVVA